MSNENIKIMADTAHSIISLIDKRISVLTDMTTSLKTSNLDNVPVEIQKMRESKSIENLCLIQELKNLKETISALYLHG